MGRIGGGLMIGGCVACMVAMTIIVAGDDADSGLHGIALAVIPGTHGGT